VKPTVLSPWFVVTRRVVRQEDCVTEVQVWYVAADDGESPWSDDRTHAMLFNSLHSAHRVARASGGDVVVVVDEVDHAEYRST